MKPVGIDFVDSRGWVRVWVLAVSVAIASCTVAWWKYQDLAMQIKAAKAASDQVGNEIAVVQQARVVPPDARQASTARVAELLQFDVNKAFTPLERLSLPGVRVRSVDLQRDSNSLRVEYELDSIQKVATVTAELNAGYDIAPWQFESVQNQVRGNAPGVSTVYATWRASLSRL